MPQKPLLVVSLDPPSALRSVPLTASTSARPSFVSSPSQLQRNEEPFYRWVILVSDKADESRPASERIVLFRRTKEVEKFYVCSDQRGLNLVKRRSWVNDCGEEGAE